MGNTCIKEVRSQTRRRNVSVTVRACTKSSIYYDLVTVTSSFHELAEAHILSLVVVKVCSVSETNPLLHFLFKMKNIHVITEIR